MSKRRYLFFVNAAYCYSIFRPLQEQILTRGDQVAWFFLSELQPRLQPNEQLLQSVQAVMSFQPDVVFTAGDWVPYFFPGAKVQVFHGIARNKRGASSEDESDHYRVRGWFDLYCTHAARDTEKFTELAAQYGTFAVAKTGWPKLDALMGFAGQSKPSVRGADIPTVFFASTFSPSITAAPVLVDAIKKLVETGRWRFKVTLHPKMDEVTMAQYRSISLPGYEFIEPENDLFASMAEADLMLCDTSSIMYEFMFLDKPVVTYRTRNPGSFLLDIDDTANLETAMQQALKQPVQQLKAARELCHELHEFTDGQSSKRVLDAVDMLLAEQLPKLKAKPFNLLRKLKLRAEMGYWKFF
ncbi:MAG: CDP-glycerol glycerophosphotransferase family protein [Marinospirillum sp.]|uniref:CDP-glycerol glycerophosphotransferase family protein n=1 Tax=Marinospirillum sp. TaxID=2183934 RepID=UPI0019E476A7|nr:CDP-glycerol glycerophosphotransferase family protein [Marinospirillum sp.]MBE0507366.1 CDP-glycerol glycerophosphotransferase family protein [Marinospirillum sp.]